MKHALAASLALASMACLVGPVSSGQTLAGAPPALPQTVPPKAKPLPPEVKSAKDPGAKDSWKPDGPDDPFLYAYGDAALYKDTPEGGVATLTGNARLLYRSTAFKSDKVVYNRRTQVGTAPGKLTVDDEQNTVVGDRGEADYGRKIARLSGNVQVTARPKPTATEPPEGSARRDFRNPVTIDASEVVYNWKTKIADTSKDAVIRFTVRDRKWTVTADRIQYRGADETALLQGSVVAKTDKGEELRSSVATVVLAEGKESIDLAPSEKGSKFLIEDKDAAPEEKPAKPDKPAEAPGKPAAPPPARPPG